MASALAQDAIADVGAVEPGGEDARGAEIEPLDDVAPRRPVRGRGERDARHRRESARAGCVSWRYSGRKSWPHCDTQCASSMAKSASRTARQELEAARHHQPLGRDIERDRARRRGCRARPRPPRPPDKRRIEERGAAPRPGAARRPDPSSTRSAARPRRRGRAAPAPESGSTATCRRPSASAPARRRRR